MKFVATKCFTCGLNLQREKRRMHETKKYNWNIYCSKECQNKTRDTRQTILCDNDACNKRIKRPLREIKSGTRHFCSQSCATTVNNKRRAIIRATICPKKYCANIECKIVIPKRNTYCSVKCRRSLDKVSKEEYAQRSIKAIKTFFRKNGRIPFKKELWRVYKPARIAFGTWNNAVLAAGFTPNPVMLAKKYTANDGHKCDSLAEKIIDDWFHARKIPHERQIPYGKNRMTADFQVGDVLIEFLGLHGQHMDYDRLVKEKQKIWQEKNLDVVVLYPRDIVSANKLAKCLQKFLPNK